jgi:hypothetical protein
MGLAIVVSALSAVVAPVAVGAGPGASAAVGVGVNRQVVHRFSLSGCDQVRRLGHHLGYASPRQGHQFARTAVSSHRHRITVNRCHMAPEAVRASVGDMDAHTVSRQAIHPRHHAHQVTRIHVLKDRVPCGKFHHR